MEVFGVVYLILNLVNGKKYVGQTVKTAAKRFNEHARQDSMIGRAIRKHGKENFRYGVIKSCASKSEMDYWEKFFIKTLKTKSPRGYNLTDGGGGCIGFAEEVLAKMSAKRKGVPKSSEHRIKLALSHRKISPFQNLLTEMNTRQIKYFELAELLGVSSVTISNKMHGRNRFTEKDANKISEIFNLPAEYLMERTDGLPATISKSEVNIKVSVAKRGDSPLKNLQNEMDKRNITQRSLGRLMGICKTSIYARMNGKVKFKANEIHKLVEIFNLPAEYLLQETV